MSNTPALGGIARTAQRALRVAGFELNRPGGPRIPYQLRRIRLPGPYAGMTSAVRRKSFGLDIESVTTAVGFSCASEGWHPYIATLNEYEHDSRLRYEESTLYRLYEQFQPESLQEAILDTAVPALAPIHRWPPWLVWPLWTLSRRNLQAAIAGASLANVHDLLYFGPVDHEEYGRRHFTRLIQLYESVKRTGYRPHAFPEDVIEGHFLARGETYRFLIVEGHHRVAVLRVLGIDSIPVRLWSGFSTVWHHELDRWSIAKGGVYPQDVIARLFDYQLREKGNTKARRLGLLA